VRIGIFGGTFDPVHWGHLFLAQGARKVLKLDRVIWVPARHPPHKQQASAVSAQDRAALVEAAIQGDPGFSISRVELDRPGPSYSIDTVRQLQAEQPGGEWFFLIGSDAAAALSTWKEIEPLREKVEFVVVPRPGTVSTGPLPRGVWAIEVETKPISASQIRQRIQAGESIQGWVPEGVRKLIERKELYK
jgi:nicotinate-nucleotide adenylyltransferase